MPFDTPSAVSLRVCAKCSPYFSIRKESELVFEKRKRDELPGWVRFAPALFFFGLGLVTAIVLAVTFGWAQAEIPLSVTPLPAVFIVAGIILLIPGWIQGSLDIGDEMADLNFLLEDDVAALTHGRLTRGVVMALISLISLGGVLYTLYHYHKWFAVWGPWNILLQFGPYNVIAVGILLGLIVAIIMIKTDWFQDRRMRTPWWIFLVPLIGVVLSGVLGVYFTEPDTSGLTQAQIQAAIRSDTYRYENTRSGSSVFINQTFINSSGGGGGGSIKLPSCSGKGCGYVYIGIALILLVVVCVLGSIFVPHFWVVATIMLLAAMAVISFRDLLFRDHRWEYSREEY